MLDISYTRIFIYGLKDCCSPGAFTIFLLFGAYISFVGSDLRRIAVSGLFFLCAINTAYIWLTLGGFDGYLSNPVSGKVLVALNCALALLFISWGIRHAVDWWKIKTNGDDYTNSIRLPGFVYEKRPTGRFKVFAGACFGLILGSFGVLVTSVWAFDYPVFVMFYELATKISTGKALPAIIYYNLGQFFPVILFWCIALLAKSSEALQVYAKKYISLWKAFSAAVCIAGGLSIFYLFINY